MQENYTCNCNCIMIKACLWRVLHSSSAETVADTLHDDSEYQLHYVGSHLGSLVTWLHDGPREKLPHRLAVASPEFGARAAHISVSKKVGLRVLAHKIHKHIRWDRGIFPCPQKNNKKEKEKIPEKNFPDKYHVKFRHFGNFSHISFGQKCLAPKVD